MLRRLLFFTLSVLAVLGYGNPLPMDRSDAYLHIPDSGISPEPRIAGTNTIKSALHGRAREIVASGSPKVSKRKELIQIDHKISLCAYTDFNKCVEFTSPDRICQTVPKEMMHGVSLQDGIVSIRFGDNPQGTNHLTFPHTLSPSPHIITRDLRTNLPNKRKPILPILRKPYLQPQHRQFSLGHLIPT